MSGMVLGEHGVPHLTKLAIRESRGYRIQHSTVPRNHGVPHLTKHGGTASSKVYCQRGTWVPHLAEYAARGAGAQKQTSRGTASPRGSGLTEQGTAGSLSWRPAAPVPRASRRTASLRPQAPETHEVLEKTLEWGERWEWATALCLNTSNLGFRVCPVPLAPFANCQGKSQFSV